MSAELGNASQATLHLKQLAGVSSVDNAKAHLAEPNNDARPLLYWAGTQRTGSQEVAYEEKNWLPYPQEVVSHPKSYQKDDKTDKVWYKDN